MHCSKLSRKTTLGTVNVLWKTKFISVRTITNFFTALVMLLLLSEELLLSGIEFNRTDLVELESKGSWKNNSVIIFVVISNEIYF